MRPGRDVWRRYGVAVAASAMAVVLRGLLDPALGPNAPLLGLVLAFTVAAWYGGVGPGLLATVLCSAAGSYFYLPPRFAFLPATPADWTHLGLFACVGALVSWLVGSRRWAVRRARESVSSLAESEERFSLLVNGVREYAIFMLDPDGRVATWNGGAERIKGYRADEVIGRDFAIFYAPEDRAAGEPARNLAAARADGADGGFHAEGWRVRRDGTRFCADVSITALRGPDGTVRGFAKVTRDVTARQAAEAEIRRLTADLERRVEERTAQLREANAELEAFAHSVAHDLRAPLRGMQGFARALLEDYGDRLDDDGRDYAGRVVLAADRMDRLIQDLLAYGRLARTEIAPERVDVRAAVLAAAAEVGPDVAARGGTVDVDEASLPVVRGHRATLGQVVVNLLSNAVKFVAPGVPPRVRVWAEPRADGMVRLWVADNGIGVDPRHQRRIFNVFERLHGQETYPGTGIGLAIVRKGAERMGGAAGVESADGAGSRFWVDLPGVAEPHAPAPSADG